MGTRARTWWLPAVVMLTMAALVGAAPGRADRSARAAFPCRFDWNLFDGLRPGFVTAGDNADCFGRRGSLRLSVRLLMRDPATGTWRTVTTRARTFRRLARQRFVEVSSPCVATAFRAVFKWVLRDPGGAVVARHRVKTRNLAVASPSCQVVIGGPGKPPSG